MAEKSHYPAFANECEGDTNLTDAGPVWSKNNPTESEAQRGYFCEQGRKNHSLERPPLFSHKRVITKSLIIQHPCTQATHLCVFVCLVAMGLFACDGDSPVSGGDTATPSSSDLSTVSDTSNNATQDVFINELDTNEAVQDIASRITVDAGVPDPVDVLVDALTPQDSTNVTSDVVTQPPDASVPMDVSDVTNDTDKAWDTGKDPLSDVVLSTPDIVETQDAGLEPNTDVATVVDTWEVPKEFPIYTTGIGPFPVGKFQETTKCVVLRLKNPEPVFVKKITQTLASGSHHLVVYRSTEIDEQPTPFDCTPFLGVLSGTVPIFISQIGDEELTYPDGVALQFEANQMIRIEAHYLNTTAEQIQAKSEIHFATVDPTTVVHQAGFLFYGTGDISIPPFSEFTSTPVFKAPPLGAKVFGLTSHQHHYGTYFKIEKATSATGAGTVIYENDNWEEPPVILLDPPLTFGNGEGLRWTCSWINTSAKKVSFGESANSEMCFLWAYYYPDQGFQCYIKAGFPLPIKGCTVQ